MRNSYLGGVLAVLVCVLSRSAVADELFKYNFVECGYQKFSMDWQGASKKIDGSAYGITGSYAIHELVAIQAGYGKATDSFNGSYLGTPVSFSGKASNLYAGITLHKMIADNTEVGFDLARNHSSTDATTEIVAGTPYAVPASTSNTNNFGIRMRTAIVPAFRLLASAGRTTGGRTASTDYAVGAEYEMSRNFSLDVEYGLGTGSGGDTRGLGISGRYYF